MPPSDLEQRAERAVRRGDLISALELFEAHLAQVPDDERARHRAEAVRSLLQPSELLNRRKAAPEGEEADAPDEHALSDAEQGEVHAAAGRFGDAVACYARAVAAQPDNELLRERYEELSTLAPPARRAELPQAERLEPMGAVATPAPGRSDRAAKALFSSPAANKRAGSAGPSAAEEPPVDREGLLRSLLDRIQRGRRPA